MQNIDIRALDTMPVEEIAKLPAAVLADLQEETDNTLALTRKRRSTLDAALDRRYGELAQAGRRELGKDTGMVRLSDNGHAILCDAKKSITWDTKILSELREKIAASGEDPDVYVVAKTELTVREAAYASWPKPVRDVFEPARQVKPGKPSYRIERPAAEAA